MIRVGILLTLTFCISVVSKKAMQICTALFVHFVSANEMTHAASV